MNTTMTLQASHSEDDLARILVASWKDGLSFDQLPAGVTPANAEQAYDVQARVVSLQGETIGGWKVGAKSLTAPVQGAPLPEDCVYFTPAWLPHAGYRHLGLELEIAFCFARPFAPRVTPYGPEEVLAGIQYMAAAIEVVSSRYHEWPAVDKLAQLADLQNHGALVVGDSTNYVADFPFQDPSVLFTFNGADVVNGAPANPAGDPRRLLPWLVNHVTARGMTLEPGAIVTTGSYTGMHFPQGPGVALGRIAGLPPVELNLE
ncbi:2-keto-4-pentenoate hydratase [Cupriavidus necator]